MAVAYVSAGTVGTGTTSVTPGLPASLATGDGVLIFVTTKPDTAVINTPASWTLIANVSGGGGTTGNQVGPTAGAVFFREKDAGWSTMPAVSITNGNSSAAIAIRATKGAGTLWDIAAATGVFGTAGTVTNCAATLGSNPGITAGDVLFGFLTNMDDGPTWSAQSVSVTGVSAYGTMTEVSEIIENTTGNDIGGMLFTVPVTTGAASANPTVNATASAATRGTTSLVRLREAVAKAGSESNSLAASDSSSLVRAPNGFWTFTNIHTSNFEAGTTDSYGSDGSLGVSAVNAGAGAHGGSWVMQLVDTTGGYALSTASRSLSGVVRPLAVSVWHRLQAGAAVTYLVSANWYNGAALIASTNLGQFTSSSGTWTNYTTDPFFTPASATGIRLKFEVLNSTGSTVYLDDIVIQGQATSSGYQEGARDYLLASLSTETASIVKTGPIITNRGQVGASSDTAPKSLPAFTPAADSKLYVMAWDEMMFSSGTLSIADTSGLSWSTKTSTFNASPNRPTIYLFEASVGSSPVSTTVTVSSTAGNNHLALAAFDVTWVTPGIKSGQVVSSVGISGGTQTSGTLPSAVTNGNLAIYAQGINTDAYNTPVTPASWNELAKMPSGSPNYEKVGVFYRTDFTGTSVSHSSTGENLGWGTVLFEIENASPADPIAGSESNSLAVSESQTLQKNFESPNNENPVLLLSESARIDLDSQVFTDTFANANNWRVFDNAAITGGRAVLTYDDGGALASISTFPRYYNLASGNSYTIEVADWVTNATVLAWDDFATIIGAWESMTYLGDKSLVDSQGTLIADASSVKYITYTNNSGNLTVTLRDASGTTLAQRNHTGFPVGSTAASISVDTQYIVTSGTATDTFELESVSPGVPDFTTQKSGNESTALSLTENPVEILVTLSRTDGAAITVTDASATLLSPTGTDSAAITVTDASTSSSTLSGSDSAAITVSEDSIALVNDTKPGSETFALQVSEQTSTASTGATTDSAAVSVADTSATAVTVASSDGAAITVTDAGANASTFSASDSAAVAVVETRAIDAASTRTDSAALSVSESAATAVSVDRTDSAAISVSEASAAVKALAGSESTALSVSETAATAVVLTGTDSAALSVGEATSGANFANASDAGSITVTETITKPAFGTDSASISVADASSLLISATVSASDSAAVSVDDTSSSFRTVVASESSSLSVSEVTNFTNTAPGQDSAALSVTEIPVIFVGVQSDDNSAVGVLEVVTKSFNTTDSVAIGVSENSTLGLFPTASDTAALSVSESSGTTGVNVLSTADSAALSVSDTSARSVSLDRTDSAALSVTETRTQQGTLTGSESTAISVADSSSTAISVARTDTAAVSVSEGTALVVLNTVSATDSAAVSVIETRSIAASLSRTDTASLAVAETTAEARFYPGGDGAALAVSESVSFSNSGSSADSGSLAISESSAVFAGVNKSGSESTAVSVSETATTLVLVVASDSASIVVTEPGGGTAGSLPGTETVSLHVVETATLSVSVAAVDSTSVSLTETGVVSLFPTAEDYATIAVDETASVFARTVNRVFPMVYYNGAWHEGTPMVYRAGTWVATTIFAYKDGEWINNQG